MQLFNGFRKSAPNRTINFLCGSRKKFAGVELPLFPVPSTASTQRTWRWDCSTHSWVQRSAEFSLPAFTAFTTLSKKYDIARPQDIKLTSGWLKKLRPGHPARPIKYPSHVFMNPSSWKVHEVIESSVGVIQRNSKHYVNVVRCGQPVKCLIQCKVLSLVSTIL